VTVAAGPEAVPALSFAVEGAEPVRHAAAPTIALALRIESELDVRSLTLNAQIRIAAPARLYDPGEQERLADLFGPPEGWGRTLRSLLWTTATLVVPAFSGATTAELAIACTYDFEVASAKYFHALADGVVPLELLFSGTVFSADEGGRLRAGLLSWSSEAAYPMPVRVWREAVELHFPNAAWLRVRRDAFDRLAQFRARRSLPTWEAVVDELLRERG
jgi:hypothetical protein